MGKSVRIAMLGCGFFAQNHLHAWKHLRPDGAELVAVCDLDAAKAETAGKVFGVPSFNSVGRMLTDAKPDVVDIATRMDSHKSLCAMLAERGIACIVQKPLAPCWDECLEIAETVQRHKAFLAIHENFRFQSPMRRVKEILESGTIGTPSWARISFRTGYDVYKNQPYFYDEQRLAILDVGIHVLDLARVFLGEVAHISCETQKRNPKVKAEDTATMMLRHDSGAVSIVECTYEARKLPDYFPQTMLEIEGNRGSIVLEADEALRVTSDGVLRRENASTPLLPWTEQPWHVVQSSVLNANAHFLDCLQKNVKAETDIVDNLKTYALVEAAYRAANLRKACVPPVWKHA